MSWVGLHLHRAKKTFISSAAYTCGTVHVILLKKVILRVPLTAFRVKTPDQPQTECPVGTCLWGRGAASGSG